jgi:hypothetical protein
MKNYVKLFGITAMTLVIGILTIDCTAKSTVLKAPANVKIDVTGRTMTVTWNAAANASGYEIITYSEGCNSGKKKINTKENTAVVYNPDNTANDGANALKDDESNGAVKILGATKIQITLMPKTAGSPEPMAAAVTVKVMSLGGTVFKTEYINSDYSQEVRKVISNNSM